ncbi:MAG: stage III sporulation protein AB [Thermobacillus sp. ZCTH02-B1]|uniref:stage III sporulation protein SpoIIIAB n=1 Tax=Thermobacillus sp. ZCTH02-B1 TaxID=1858795 RepID=UPI000B54BB68|nr:stage III sporulation protein SpoIIIAB [Thermobacillus sp. ZCTH02-B1]OUM96876.1 MAG: stage III sporulation protein AB [Thermobacillus sp. ZCTH02-B1]
MLKLAGAMLVLVSGTLIGFRQAARYADRTAQIRDLLHALQRLETEIGFGHTPLPEALGRAATGAAEPVAAIFIRTAERLRADGASVRDALRAAVAEVWPRTAMREPERAALTRLGDALGISDREDQIRHLRLAAALLAAEEAGARDEQIRYGKMWRSLGFMAALLVVILML